MFFFVFGWVFYCQPCLLSLPLAWPGAPPFAAASTVPRPRSGARFVAPLLRLLGSAAGTGSTAAASAIAGRARTTTVLLVTTARAAIVVHHDNVVVGFSGSMLAYLQIWWTFLVPYGPDHRRGVYDSMTNLSGPSVFGNIFLRGLNVSHKCEVAGNFQHVFCFTKSLCTPKVRLRRSGTICFCLKIPFW